MMIFKEIISEAKDIALYFWVKNVIYHFFWVKQVNYK
jgi:hypothetical protein